MVSKLGIIGFSDGNGHPYSFSAIINGYDAKALKESGWTVIHDYLEKRKATEFGIDGLSVDYVWTQNVELSQQIASATKIPNVCVNYIDMLDHVDAVIIARDDWQSHHSIAMSFLSKGKHVFVDKPLSLDIEELKTFKPFLESGKLMSCAALRYAVEFDEYRQSCLSEKPFFISGTIVSDWERYGVHLLDGIFSGVTFNVESVFSSGTVTPVTSILNCSDGTKISINCLGQTTKTFNLSCYFKEKKASYDMNDNFSAFKRTLSSFRDMIQKNTPMIEPSLTLNIMKTLIAARISQKENRLVYLHEINI